MNIYMMDINSYPRRRIRCAVCDVQNLFWIPAFAGMTQEVFFLLKKKKVWG